MNTIINWAIRNNIPEIKLPRREEDLLALVTLDLQATGISDLPDSLGLLQNLKSLYIGYNYLKTLPRCIG